MSNISSTSQEELENLVDELASASNRATNAYNGLREGTRQRAEGEQGADLFNDDYFKQFNMGGSPERYRAMQSVAPRNSVRFQLQEYTSSSGSSSSSSNSSSSSSTGNNRKYVKRPIPLITVHNGVFKVNEECAEILTAIKSPIAVVSVAGTYRTGKSFILNQLLGRQDG